MGGRSPRSRRCSLPPGPCTRRGQRWRRIPAYLRDERRSQVWPLCNGRAKRRNPGSSDRLGGLSGQQDGAVVQKSAEGHTENAFAALVPQVEIGVGDATTVSILDVGHRIGDALVRSSTPTKTSRPLSTITELAETPVQSPSLLPLSIVFGAWDSRGEQAKLPRIVQSVIRAWDVEPLHRSARV